MKELLTAGNSSDLINNLSIKSIKVAFQMSKRILLDTDIGSDIDDADFVTFFSCG